MLIYYTAPGASGDGLTPDTPSAISAAQSLARNGVATDDVTILMRDGVYPLASPLVFASIDSGVNGHTISWEAYPGESPVLSGALNVTGWELYDPGLNIYRAAVPVGTQSRDLFINGSRVRRARREVNMISIEVAPDGSTASTTDLSLQNLTSPSDLEFVFTASWQIYEQNRLGVVNAQSVGGLTTFTMSPNASWGWGQWVSHPSWIENAYEFLGNAPGQWYLNSTAGYVYYKPRQGEDMSIVDAKLAVLECLISGTSLSNVKFSDISFSHTTWLWPTTQKVLVQYQANQCFQAPAGEAPGVFPPAAVDMSASQGVQFTGCLFRNLGTMGLRFDSGATGGGAANCVFYDIAANGICIGGFTNFNVEASWIAVDNCLISNVANEYDGGVGILVGFADHISLLRNAIYKIPYSGISFGWGWNAVGYETSLAGSNEVAYNRIVDVMNGPLKDGGAFYTLGHQATRSSFHDNYITQVGTDARWPVYNDNGSTNWDIYNNVVVITGVEYDEFGQPIPAHWYLANTGAYGNAAPADSNFSTTITKTGNGNSSQILTPTLITGIDPANWPVAAQNIVAAAISIPPSVLNSTNTVTTGVVSGGYTTLDVGEYIQANIESPGKVFQFDTQSLGPGTIEFLLDGIVVKTLEIP